MPRIASLVGVTMSGEVCVKRLALAGIITASLAVRSSASVRRGANWLALCASVCWDRSGSAAIPDLLRRGFPSLPRQLVGLHV